MTAPYRVLVTGSREWPDKVAVLNALAEVFVAHDAVTVVHGACPTGADAMADQVAREWDGRATVTVETHPADWDHCGPTCRPRHRIRKRAGDVHHPGVESDYCPGAGPRRNREMVTAGADLCLAFITPASVGGARTACLAEAAGIRTVRFKIPNTDYVTGARR